MGRQEKGTIKNKIETRRKEREDQNGSRGGGEKLEEEKK